MTTTPGNASSNLPGKPPVVDLATWEAAREELLVREKAHTREGDAIAAARRQLPMVELDGTVQVTGPDGPVSFLDLLLALGRRRRRQLGSDQPARAAVDPPGRDPRGDPRPPGSPPLTRVPSGWTWPARSRVRASYPVRSMPSLRQQPASTPHTQHQRSYRYKHPSEAPPRAGKQRPHRRLGYPRPLVRRRRRGHATARGAAPRPDDPLARDRRPARIARPPRLTLTLSRRS